MKWDDGLQLWESNTVKERQQSYPTKEYVSYYAELPWIIPVPVLIGLPELGGIHQDESIPLLRASLLKDQAVKDAVKPIKETIGIFNSITNWLNRLVH